MSKIGGRGLSTNEPEARPGTGTKLDRSLAGSRARLAAKRPIGATPTLGRQGKTARRRLGYRLLIRFVFSGIAYLHRCRRLRAQAQRISRIRAPSPAPITRDRAVSIQLDLRQRWLGQQAFLQNSLGLIFGYWRPQFFLRAPLHTEVSQHAFRAHRPQHPTPTRRRLAGDER
jgi:hypothetical protein